DNTDSLDGRKNFSDFRNRHRQLARSDRCKLIEHLYANDSPRREQCLSPISLRRILRKEIKQDVGIEKAVSLAHWLPADQTENRRAVDRGICEAALTTVSRLAPFQWQRNVYRRRGSRCCRPP